MVIEEIKNIKSGKRELRQFGVTIGIALKPIQKIWMAFAALINWFLTSIILIILFYLVVTPIGILAKIFGKHFLDTKLDTTADTYWITRQTAKSDRRSYENQW